MNCDVEYGRASFKGIEFEIQPVTNTIGQRKVVNLYPFSDRHYNESLGRKPERWSVQGLFTGEDARDQLQVAKRVWGGDSVGVFFEPMENRRHTVELDEDVVFSYDHRKINHVTFTLNLIEAARDPYPARASSLLSRVNGIIDDFIDDVSNYYSDVVEVSSQFIDVVTGFDAATDFVFNTVRQTVSGIGFADVVSSVGGATASRTPSETVDSVVSIFETALEQDAPIAFFEQASEVRVGGNPTEEAQGFLYALVSLSYYFQLSADNGVTYTELQNFREHAQALKDAVPDIPLKDAIDSLICELGQGADHIECKTRTGTHNALVASYELYGDISRAYELMGYSGGVSGAALTPLSYR